MEIDRIRASITNGQITWDTLIGSVVHHKMFGHGRIVRYDQLSRIITISFLENGTEERRFSPDTVTATYFDNIDPPMHLRSLVEAEVTRATRMIKEAIVQPLRETLQERRVLSSDAYLLNLSPNSLLSAGLLQPSQPITVFKPPHPNDEQNPYAWGRYIPRHKRRFMSEADDATYSDRILALKGHVPSAVSYFADLLEPTLGTDFAIAIVPSHDASRTISGIRLLAQRLAQNRRIDATVCLTRHTTIPELKTQKTQRPFQLHLDSIAVVRSDLIRGRTVLLLDDIYTSGNSLAACRHLLLAEGAARVYPAALGKTQNWVT